jgi:parallel beta-helix repeat protein
MIRFSTFASTLLLAALAAMPAGAQEGQRRLVGALGSTTVINEPGHYFLARDIDVTAGTAIRITASDVTLDLRGFRVMGPGGNTGRGIEIMGASGVRVMNGTVANFGFAVVVDSSASVVLRDLTIRGQGLAVSAPPPEVGIMIVQSRNMVVENNRLYNVGLGIFVRGGMSWGNRISGNTVTSGMNGVFGICYNPAPNDPMGPRGDLLEGNHISGFPIGIQMSATSGSNILRNNSVAYKMSALELLNATNVVENNTSVMLP